MKKHLPAEHIEASKCSHNSDCSFVNRGLDAKIAEYARLGAVPHCCFAELLNEAVITGMTPETDGATGFYASISAFYAECPHATEHCHGKLAWLAEMFVKGNSIRLHSSGGDSVVITAPEAAKLLTQAQNYLEDEVHGHLEEIAIEDGEQLIFASPDPELPAAFIEYLETVFSPLHEVAAVYAFSASRPDQNNGVLTIGIEPAARISREEADRLSFLIVEGVERFLEDHDQLDFIVIEDDELAEIVRSVSPAIKLDR